ncbi:DUF58 domain-containing protein [Halorubrum sp. CBA1125]|uniref:DUF58 domain-containing protein n=1 Tax=Halorubrum sp. CBA1125 TaxID=2668072 RepID=UPI0012E73E21|nr:DUF58 domain-containing protein [Halorubrum sp. CBA1125]MUW13534.1 DUF58 domain-containing protein [Halorubrum sp. CBA1125]
MPDAYLTDRWRGILVVTLGTGGFGLLARRPSLLLVAALGVVFAAYPRVSSPPEPSLRLERRVSDDSPTHGEPFEVTTTVRNVGDAWIPDLRTVDGLPPALSVVEGTPRHGTALRPGEAASFSYVVEARRGQHRFDPATVVARDVTGGHEVELEIDAETETAVDCASSVPRAPLRAQTTADTGRIAADHGGTGTEFYQTRAYRRGDAIGRVDWNRYAQTGDLTTVEFRAERAATVVLVVDARPAAYRGSKDEPHAVAYSVAAARELVDTMLANRNRVGVAGFGRDVPWLSPGTGRDHRVRAQDLLSRHATFQSRPPTGSVPDIDEQAAQLRARLPDDAQVIVFSPLLDDDLPETIRLLDSRGHAVSVTSPDVTGSDGPGETLVAIERDDRLRRLRAAGIPVVDWSPERSLAATLLDTPGVLDG